MPNCWALFRRKLHYSTVYLYGHHIYSQSMDQPRKVANPARGQLNRENGYSPVPVRAWELVSREGFSRPVPRQPAHSPYSGWIWCLLTGILPISAAASLYLFKPPYAIGSVPILSGHAIARQWRSLPRVRRHRASSPQGNSSNGRCHFAGPHGPN